MSEPAEFHPCVGICKTDADAAYCLGCGRPWGEPRPALLPAPSVAEAPAAPPPVSDED